MAFDGVTLHSVINELQLLVDGKVNQIHQPNSNNITISIYVNKEAAFGGTLQKQEKSKAKSNQFSEGVPESKSSPQSTKSRISGTFLLNIDTSASNYRIHVSTHSKPNPYQAPNFCMLLRKYLIGGRIKKIYMKGLERICYIDFECFNEMNDMVTRTLVVELMGKYSNVILLNDNESIIDALKKFDVKDPFESSYSSSRSIMPARKYDVPIETKADIETISENKFEELISSSEDKTLETAVPNLFTGISKIFMQGCLEKLHLSNNIGHKNIVEIYNYIKNILSEPGKIYCENFKKSYNVYYDIEDEQHSSLRFFR